MRNHDCYYPREMPYIGSIPVRFMSKSFPCPPFGSSPTIWSWRWVTCLDADPSDDGDDRGDKELFLQTSLNWKMLIAANYLIKYVNSYSSWSVSWLPVEKMEQISDKFPWKSRSKWFQGKYFRHHHLDCSGVFGTGHTIYSKGHLRPSGHRLIHPVVEVMEMETRGKVSKEEKSLLWFDPWLWKWKILLIEMSFKYSN